jgi:uncharacterized protein (TIGR03437 family)
MSGSRRILCAKFAVVLAVVPALIYAYSGGPDPRKTGAPGDGLCIECHSPAANTGSGNVSVAFASGLTYTPGAKQRLTVTVTDSAAKRWGFQLTARLATNETNGQAGAFNSVDASTQVICGDGSPKQAAGCPASAPLEFIEHTQSGNGSSTFTFDWTAPASDVGDVRFYVAGNAANGNGRNDAGDLIYTANYKLTAAVTAPKPAITQGGVVNAWNSQPVFSDSSWVTLYGSNFTTSQRTWRTDEIVGGKLPTELDGVKVSINGKPAYVYFISPNQLNVQAPSDGAVGPVQVQVTTPGGTSDPVTVTKQALAPAFFTWAGSVVGGEKYLGAVISDGTFAGKTGLLQPLGVNTRPVKPGEVILVFGTGFGPTNPDIAAGQVVATPSRMTTGVKIFFGDTEAEIFDTGYLIFSGEYQFNVKVPANLADGDYKVAAQMGSARTQDNVFITVQK